uniref:Uncharacterized protein n=1 Tax=Astyanax mexicanus TaxID=7994 RepID=A0A3B1J2Y8_ASTMX
HPVTPPSRVQHVVPCGVCEQIQTDPVSITCGHTFCRQCINSCWDQSAPSGDFACPRCKKRSKTRPVLYPLMEETTKQHYCPPVSDDLPTVLEKHRTSVKNRYESLFEGFKTQENKILLNRIYTQLYIIEGESEGVNEEHEVLQMEKELWKQLQELPINCLDIFKPVEGTLGGMGAENIRAWMAEERKEDEGKEVQKLRTVLTKASPKGLLKKITFRLVDYIDGCDLTLDPNTANRYLSLSEENRRVEYGRQQPYPDHPERFDGWAQVLSRERVTGRCYWEAEWSGALAAVALSYKTISRKGGDSGFGRNEKSWSLKIYNNRYSVYHNNNSTDLPPPPSPSNRVGVYVDCPAGTLSFYTISSHTHTHSSHSPSSHTPLHTPSHAQTLTHLHTFYTTFTEPLYAGFYVFIDSSVRLCDIE